MVLDSSAIVAILFGEKEEKEFLGKMAAATHLFISAVSLVETGVVLMRNGDERTDQKLDPFLRRAGVQIIPVDEAQALLAREAYRRFGKRRHLANLNFGDCFSYSLAMQMGDTLLFKGNDFSQTDVPGA